MCRDLDLLEADAANSSVPPDRPMAIAAGGESLSLSPLAGVVTATAEAPAAPRRRRDIRSWVRFPRAVLHPAVAEADPAYVGGVCAGRLGAGRVGRPLDPWQEDAVIRAGELRPDGSLRFRKVFVMSPGRTGRRKFRDPVPYWLFEDQPG